MRTHNGRLFYVFFVLCMIVFLAACTPTSAPGTTTPESAAAATDTPTPTPSSTPTVVVIPTATATLTPTPLSGGDLTSPDEASRCEGLTGELEIQVLVGPAEIVGLEPVAVGSVPFVTTSSGVEGQGAISYEDVLPQDWGTYAVTLDMDIAVQGECSGSGGDEQLDLVLEMTGEQLIAVNASGFVWEYPWEGTQSLDLSFPLQEGATAEGEGWVVVLHLSS